jgi:tRNA A-37 threonylcarbamoyl transferase component Bud32
MADQLEITTGMEALLSAAGIGGLSDLLDPALGEPVTKSRSSWVRRVPAGARAVYVKCYVYPTLKDVLLRILSRRFLWHRARREWRNLGLQERLGVAAAKRVAFGERRRSGVLRAAVLVTEAIPGAAPLDEWLRDGKGGPSIAGQAGRYVARMHLAGFAHGDLNARNLLLSGPEPEIRNVDSGRGHPLPWAGRLTRHHVRDVAPLVLAFRVLRDDQAAEAMVAAYLEEMDLGAPAGFDGRVEAEIRRIEAKERARLGAPTSADPLSPGPGSPPAGSGRLAP